MDVRGITLDVASNMAKQLEALGLRPRIERRNTVYQDARRTLRIRLAESDKRISEEEALNEFLILDRWINEIEEELVARPDSPNISLESLEDFSTKNVQTAHQLSSPRGIYSERWLLKEVTPANWSEPLPALEIIPKQDERAIVFRSTRFGPIELASDPPTHPFEPEQGQLYSRIRSQIVRLQETVPTQERSQIDYALQDFLNQPKNWSEVKYKKILWLCGNSLRSLLNQHDAVKDDPEPNYAKLPPAVAEALRRPVEGWNIFVLGDADLLELDSRKIGPQEQQELSNQITAAKPIISSAESDRNLITERAATAINQSIKAAESDAADISKKLAQDLAGGSSRNLIAQILRRAYIFCRDIVDPRTAEAEQLSTEYKKGISKAIGTLTVTAVVTGATMIGAHAGLFFDFVAAHALILKHYIMLTFQNVQLAQIVEIIERAKIWASKEASK